jgi:hypothetical protein
LRDVSRAQGNIYVRSLSLDRRQINLKLCFSFRTPRIGSGKVSYSDYFMENINKECAARSF